MKIIDQTCITRYSKYHFDYQDVVKHFKQSNLHDDNLIYTIHESYCSWTVCSVGKKEGDINTCETIEI